MKKTRPFWELQCGGRGKSSDFKWALSYLTNEKNDNIKLPTISKIH